MYWLGVYSRVITVLKYWLSVYYKSLTILMYFLGVLSVFKCVGTWRYRWPIHRRFRLRQSKFTYVIRVENRVRNVSFWIMYLTKMWEVRKSDGARGEFEAFVSCWIVFLYLHLVITLKIIVDESAIIAQCRLSILRWNQDKILVFLYSCLYCNYFDS